MLFKQTQCVIFFILIFAYPLISYTHTLKVKNVSWYLKIRDLSYLVMRLI